MGGEKKPAPLGERRRRRKRGGGGNAGKGAAKKKVGESKKGHVKSPPKIHIDKDGRKFYYEPIKEDPYTAYQVLCKVCSKEFEEKQKYYSCKSCKEGPIHYNCLHHSDRFGINHLKCIQTLMESMRDYTDMCMVLPGYKDRRGIRPYGHRNGTYARNFY